MPISRKRGFELKHLEINPLKTSEQVLKTDKLNVKCVIVC